MFESNESDYEYTSWMNVCSSDRLYNIDNKIFESRMNEHVYDKRNVIIFVIYLITLKQLVLSFLSIEFLWENVGWNDQTTTNI